MDVSAHFNSQFVMIDFELLDNPEFMRFVGSTAFSVYLTPAPLRLAQRGARAQRRVCTDLYGEAC